MRLKAIFKHRGQIVAEFPFDVSGNPRAASSGDLADGAKKAFEEFARRNSAFSLVNGDVWIKFETVDIPRP
jgi:hypothetical protein